MKKKIEKLVRPNILALQPYSSARDEYKGDAKIYLDANESPFGLFNRYPDPMQNALKERIANMKGVDKSQLFLGNGSDECIDLLYRIFCQPGVDKALTFTPTYGMYEVSAGINDVPLIKLPLDTNFQVEVNGFKPYLTDVHLKLIFLCSPNNPTGNLLLKESVEFILENFEGIVVIDEAYIDYANTTSWTAKIEEYENLVVLQTLSKAYGMANLRVGMAISHASIIQLMNKVKPPYNISGLVQSKALEMLANEEAHAENIAVTKLERIKMIQTISSLSSVVKVHPSSANFLLIELQDAEKRYKALKSVGIIVRNRVNVIENCLRITIGSPDENDTLLKALQTIDKASF